MDNEDLKEFITKDADLYDLRSVKKEVIRIAEELHPLNLEALMVINLNVGHDFVFFLMLSIKLHSFQVKIQSRPSPAGAFEEKLGEPVNIIEMPVIDPSVPGPSKKPKNKNKPKVCGCSDHNKVCYLNLYFYSLPTKLFSS